MSSYTTRINCRQLKILYVEHLNGCGELYTYNGPSKPEKTRFVKYSRLIGFIHKITKINGNTKLIFNINCRKRFSRQYFNESQCIRAIRRPGNVKTAPIKPHKTAIQNLTISFDAGPLENRHNSKLIFISIQRKFVKNKMF